MRKQTFMDISMILVNLRQERERLENAILSLERLVLGRGSPLASLSATTPPKKRGRPLGSKTKSTNIAGENGATQ